MEHLAEGSTARFVARLLERKFRHHAGGRTMVVSNVAIVGAGPYGLSIAAHLAAR